MEPKWLRAWLHGPFFVMASIPLSNHTTYLHHAALRKFAQKHDDYSTTRIECQYNITLTRLFGSSRRFQMPPQWHTRCVYTGRYGYKS
jgi:hypothetical protein